MTVEETSKDRQEEDLAKLAHKLGYDHGRNAGSWVFDGNTTEETYRWFLKGLEDGDPEVLDRLPTSPLSGEWADSYSLADLADDLDIDQEDDGFDDLCWEYEGGYAMGVEDEVHLTAGQHVRWACLAAGTHNASPDATCSACGLRGGVA